MLQNSSLDAFFFVDRQNTLFCAVVLGGLSERWCENSFMSPSAYLSQEKCSRKFAFDLTHIPASMLTSFCVQSLEIKKWRKMRYLSISCAIATTMILSGCATVQLPKNALLIESDGNTYLSKIDFSYTARKNIDFSKAKLCVAENISNPDVTIRDAAGSFVGSYSRTYYQTNNVQNISGKELFKYLDDTNSVLIANGTISAKTAFAIIEIIKFEMKLTISGSKVGFLLSNLARAQQDTGYLTNRGFKPIGVWSMSRSEEIYFALEQMANAVKSCINS